MMNHTQPLSMQPLSTPASRQRHVQQPGWHRDGGRFASAAVGSPWQRRSVVVPGNAGPRSDAPP